MVLPYQISEQLMQELTMDHQRLQVAKEIIGDLAEIQSKPLKEWPKLISRASQWVYNLHEHDVEYSPWPPSGPSEHI